MRYLIFKKLLLNRNTFMRKFICLSGLIICLQMAAYTQTTSASAKEAKATEEIKTALSSQLHFSATVIEKIIPIENEFHASISATNALENLSLKEKEKRLGAAHVTRRAKLMEIPLTGRETEDVVLLVETIRRKNKL